MLVDRCYSDRGAIKTPKAEREVNSYAPCFRNPDQSRKFCAGPLWAGELTVEYILLLLWTRAFCMLYIFTTTMYGLDSWRFGPITQQMLTPGLTGWLCRWPYSYYFHYFWRNSADTSRETPSFSYPSAPNVGLVNTHTEDSCEFSMCHLVS